MVRNYYWSQALKVQNLVIRWPRAGIYKNSHRDLSFWVARQSVDSSMVHPRSSPERKPDLWRQKWHHGESWLFVACFFTKKVKKVEVEAFWAPRLSKLQHPLPPRAQAHTHTHTHTRTMTEFTFSQASTGLETREKNHTEPSLGKQWNQQDSRFSLCDSSPSLLKLFGVPSEHLADPLCNQIQNELDIKHPLLWLTKWILL